MDIVKTTFFHLLACTLASTFAVDAVAQPACKIEAFPSLPDVRLVSASAETVPVTHCRVAGVIGTETNFELLLPDEWNGKFVMGGGGGFVGSTGVVSNAALGLNVLEDGWATVGTDTGHAGHSLDASWALNNLERVVSFGHQAVHRTAVNSKPLIEAYYDKEIARSLFWGCSRGGGQALMEAQMYPEDFEGIYAGAPAYDWTREMGARWTRIANLMYPDSSQILEPVIDGEALKLIGDSVMAQCDALDGLEDGVLNDPRQCNFDVASLACGTTTTNACLSPEQVEVAEAIYGDFEIGGRVIPGTPVGAEMPGNPLGWEQWYTGGYEPEGELEYHEGAASGEFPSPRVPNATWAFASGVMRYFLYNDPDWSYSGYDFSDFAEKAARVAPTVNADNPDLSAFRARGGKLIIDNGWMDGSLSAYGTIDYYERVLALDPTAADDVRLFIRPGIAHCRNGPGPDGTDYLAALDRWMETGEPPEQLLAPYIGPDRNPTGGGRIICAHPNVVTYDGQGDPHEPASFSCTAPR